MVYHGALSFREAPGMLILLDGYNVIAPPGRIAMLKLPAHRRPPADWLRDQRNRLVQTLADGLGPELARKTTIIFDAADAPPGLPSLMVEQGITIEFSVGYREADDRLEELIAAHHAPKRLTVVSSDHRVQLAARRRGALAVDGEAWLDRLTDGKPLLAIPWPPPSSVPKPQESEKPVAGKVDEWLEAFEMEPDSPQEKRRPWHPFPEGYGEDLL